MRFKRLKRPKYLIGAIIGAVYFYWYFGYVLFGFGRRDRWNASGAMDVASLPADPLLFESLGALIFFVVVLIGWVMPSQRAALAFTEAEVAFLFPAPVSRRGLIHFKLLRSQLGLLFTVLLFTLISSRFGASGHWLTRAAGWWIILFTLNLHFIGSSFALTMLMDRGISNRKRRVVLLLLVLLMGGGLFVWASCSMPDFTVEKMGDVAALVDYARQFLTSGPLPYLLYPFRLVVKPYLAPDAFSFLLALWPAALLLVAHYVWVIRSNVAFEEASVEASKKLADKIAAARAGKWSASGKGYKRKRAPFTLRPTGIPLTAFLWKNLVSAGSAFTTRTWIMLAIIAVSLVAGVLGTSRNVAWPAFLAIMSGMFGLWALMLGPQIMRQDFRQDLPNADVLKAFPLRGWQIALGEILAPAAILTGVQWLLLIVGTMVAVPLTSERIPVGIVFAVSGGMAIILPAWNLVSLIIPNAAVLWFPSWVQTGRDAPQGMEAMGQRLIFAFGQFFALVLTLIPAAVVFMVTFWVVMMLLTTPFLAIPLASLGAALVLTVEVSFGVVLLGRLFERLDLSAEQTV